MELISIGWLNNCWGYKAQQKLQVRYFYKSAWRWFFLLKTGPLKLMDEINQIMDKK